MHRKFSAFLFFVLIAVFSIHAQSGEWYWDQPISKIDFSGLNNVKKSELQGVISSYINQPFTDTLYNDLLDRLYSLDYFEDITPYAKHDPKDESKVLLVFEVVERPVIKTINFIGNKKIRNGELREKIKIKVSDVFVESQVLMDERLIRNYYLEKGYTASSISHKVEATPDGMIVTFDISEGNNSVIREITFSGNTIASNRTLKNKISLKEVGLFRDGAYQPSSLEQDKQAIIKYYNEHGYADANILDVKVDSTLNEDKMRDELTIHFIIQEGAQYTYSGLRIKGNEIFTESELLRQRKLKNGQIFNATKFQEDITAVTNVYYSNGYMTNEYYPVPVKDIDRHEISYDLTIVEHSRSHIENIIIKGNTKTKEFVIKREIPIEPGDTFTNDKIYNGIRNLMNLRYFSNIVPDAQPGTEENLYDLIFTVEEQATSSVQFGVSFTGAIDPGTLPVSLYLNLENSNLFGEGRTLSVGGQVSGNEQFVNFAYSQNWLGSLPIAFTTSLSLRHSLADTYINFWTPAAELVQNRYTVNYHSWDITVSSGLSRRWIPDYAIITLAGGVSSSLQRNIFDENLYIPIDTGVSLYANRWGISNSVFGNFAIDNRDLSYDPTRGWFFNEKVSWFGIIPGLEKEFFARSDTKLEGYLKLIDLPVSEKWSFKLVLAGYTGLSAIIPFSEVSEGNNVYIDGMLNGRGWTDAEVYKESKGLLMLSNRLELRFPIVPGIIGIDGFWDAAATKSRVQDINKFKIEDFYFSFGPGIRFLVPQLPLHLMFAWRYRIVDSVPKFAETPFQFVLSFNIVNN